MDEGTLLLALVAVAAIGIAAVVLILRTRRISLPKKDREFAASTEGETRCPACGMGNLWTDARCVSCGARLA